MLIRICFGSAFIEYISDKLTTTDLYPKCLIGVKDKSK